jgi:hypothetical protein
MNSKISAAWQTAGSELDVRVVAPCEVRTASGKVVVCEAYLPDFGSPKGAIVLGYDGTDTFRSQLGEYWCSVSYEPYEKFSPTLFVDTLNDWGWFGAIGMQPNWYGGARSS